MRKCRHVCVCVCVCCLCVAMHSKQNKTSKTENSCLKAKKATKSNWKLKWKRVDWKRVEPQAERRSVECASRGRRGQGSRFTVINKPSNWDAGWASERERRVSWAEWVKLTSLQFASDLMFPSRLHLLPHTRAASHSLFNFALSISRRTYLHIVFVYYC